MEGIHITGGNNHVEMFLGFGLLNNGADNIVSFKTGGVVNRDTKGGKNIPRALELGNQIIFSFDSTGLIGIVELFAEGGLGQIIGRNHIIGF